MGKNTPFHKPNNSNSLLGLLIILFGLLLLIDQLIPNLDFLDWIFSWPMILIVIGLYIGSKSRFENPTSYILIGIGAIFLASEQFNLNFGRLIWPVILIVIGFGLITGKKRKFFNSKRRPTNDPPLWDKRVYNEEEGTATENEDTQSYASTTERDEGREDPFSDAYNENNFIDSTSIFGRNKNFIVSKNFKGGNVVNIMGGTEINLMQADIQGTAILEVVQLFGGSTVIAPAHWVIQPEMVSIFGGIEDKRFSNATPDYNKVLCIRGTSLFGGLTIKSI